MREEHKFRTLLCHQKHLWRNSVYRMLAFLCMWKI